jgi:site-specific DNA recombinase
MKKDLLKSEIPATEGLKMISSLPLELQRFLGVALPQIEKQKISIRTKEGIRLARLRGCYTSKAPIGYKNVRVNSKSTLKFNSHSTIIQKAYDMIVNENQTINSVRQMLKNKGIKKSNKELKYILSNRVYLGEINVPAFKDQSDKFVKGLHKPLVSEHLFQKANVLLDSQNYPSINPN